jgi:hypothetical protein
MPRADVSLTTMLFGSEVTVPFAGAARTFMTTRLGLYWLS